MQHHRATGYGWKWPVRGGNGLVVALVAAAQTACLSPVHVRSARPLAPGENEVTGGLSAASASRSAVQWFNGTNESSPKAASSQGLVNLIPEVGYRRGLGNDIDVGARVGGAAGLVALEGAWRFHHRPMAAGELHLGTGLQTGTWFASAVRSTRVVVPLRATVDLANIGGGTLSASASVHGGWQWVQRDEVAASTPPATIENTRWTLGNDSLTAGGGVLVDWRDDAWTVGLGCEVDHWRGRIGASGREQASYGVTAVQGVLTAGWRWGKDAARLKKAADELDSLTRQPAQ
jgi:hypothetical protein